MYNETFNTIQNENTCITYKQFVKNFSKIIKYLRDLNKRNQELKKEMLSVFSTAAWEKLSDKRKGMHSIHNCKGCLHDPNLKQLLAKLPIKSLRFNNKAKKAGLHKEKILKEITNECVNQLNENFEAKFKTSFIKQAKKYVEGFQEQKTSKIAESVGKAVSKDCTKQYAETSVLRYVK